MRKFFVALAIGLAGVAPSMAQTVDPLQSEELIRKAINQPGTAWSIYGNGQTTKIVKDPEIPGGQYVRVTVAAKGKNAWDIGASYEVIKPIKPGDVIFFAVYARAPDLKDGETAALPGMGVGMAGDPYTPIAITDARITNRWAVYYASAKAIAGYGRMKARGSLQLAADKQVIDLGPAFVLNLGPDYDIATLPHN